MSKIIVLVTEGKDDNTHFAKVVLFDTVIEANLYIDEISSKVRTKYWTQAEIVNDRERIEISSPDFDNM